MKDDPKKKKKHPGAGMSGSTSKMSRADEVVYGKALEGKTDASTRAKHIAALNVQHAKTGEAKSSYSGRTKKNTKNATLDTRTGKRTNEKRKLTDAQKVRAQQAAYNVRQGKKAAKKVQRK